VQVCDDHDNPDKSENSHFQSSEGLTYGGDGAHRAG
jgi:hypothetical protein